MPKLEGFPNLRVGNWDKKAESHWAVNTTVRCPHRCIYCFEGSRQGLKDVATGDTKKLLDRAAAEVSGVVFMGAEPTANPALPELIRYARSLGLRAMISTNALRLANWDYLCSLREAGVGGIELSFPYPDDAVYARITAAKPAGFSRLLRAIENIERLNRTAPADQKHSVTVNVVVSRFNVERLEEVIAHLTPRLTRGSYRIKLKRVHIRPDLDEKTIREVYVPCSALRTALPRLAEQIPAGVHLNVDDFPLCAIPGLEPLAINLGYWLNDVSFRHNFLRQERMEEEFAHVSLDKPHPFDWICEPCALSPICISRELFLHAAPEQAPQPVIGGIPERLRAWVRAQAKGDAVWEIRRKRTVRGWALGEILKRAPPERPLAATGIYWSPLQFGVLRLAAEGRTAEFRLSRDCGTAPGRLFSLLPSEPPVAPGWAEPGIAALDAALRSLSAPPPDCLLDRDSGCASLSPLSRPGAPAPTPRPASAGGLLCLVEVPGLWTSERRFHIAGHLDGRPCFQRAGNLMLWYSHGEMDPAATSFANVLLLVMRALKELPTSRQGLARWETAVSLVLDRMGLAKDYDWTLKPDRNGGLTER